MGIRPQSQYKNSIGYCSLLKVKKKIKTIPPLDVEKEYFF